MTPDPILTDQLTPTFRSIAGSQSPAEVLQLLLEGSRASAPRVAVYLVRRGEIQGWGSSGYPAEAEASQRAFRGSLAEGWLGRLAREEASAILQRGPAELDPDFGQPAPTETVGTAVRIEGKPVALIVAERLDDEDPWQPSGLAMLACMAQLRLQLNLALRKARQDRAAAAAPAVSAEPPMVPAPAEGPSASAVAAAPEAEPGPELDVARRYARLIATDIRLYNEDEVMHGRRAGDLLDRLGSEMKRGKDTFLRRHGDMGARALELLRDAYVQVLAGGDDSLIPDDALE